MADGAVEVTVSGRTAKELRDLAKALKSADKEMQLSLARNIRVAASTAKPAVKASALEMLPKRGGLAALVADGSKITTSVAKSGNRVGVRIKIVGAGHVRVAGKIDVSALNRGKLRHPIYARPGQPRNWVLQDVPAGFADKPLEALKPATQVAIRKALAEITAKLEAAT